MPMSSYGTRSQAWSMKTVPNWSNVTLTNASLATGMGPLAALVAALLHIDGGASLADAAGSGSFATAARCQTFAATTGTTSHLHSSIDELYGQSWSLEHLSTRGTATTSGTDYGPRQVLGASVGEITAMPSFGNNPRGQSTDLLPEVPQLQARGTDAVDSSGRLAEVEQHPGVSPDRHDQGCQWVGIQCKRPTATKTRAKPKIKPEVKEEIFEDAVFIGDPEDVEVSLSDITMENPPRNQESTICQRGLQVLMTNAETHRLLWNCNNQECVLHCQDQEEQLLPAQGVLLCFKCNAAEMMPISATDDPQETQVQCVNQNCRQTAYLFELPLVYSRMGRFRIEKLE